MNCTGHRKKVYAASFFTNGSFLQPLDNEVSFHDALALEVLSGDVNKTVLLDATYCCTQWQGGFSLKAECHTTLHNLPRKGRPFSFTIFSHFSVSQRTSN